MSGRRLRLLGALALGGVLLLALWALLVFVASRPALRVVVDLTPQHVNSIDPVTEELLRDLRAQQAEIELHLLYPPYSGQGGDALQRQVMSIRLQLRERVRLLLQRYQALGGESLTIHAHDFYGESTKTRDAVQAFGYTAADDDTVVVAVRMPGRERRFRKLSTLFDLAVIERPNAGMGVPQQGSLPVLKRFLGEEQFSSAIKSLLVEGTPVAYVLRDFSPFVDYSEQPHLGYGLFAQQLARTGFEVKPWEVRSQAAVPADATLVIVLEPTREFSDGVADALFAFVKRGGNVFLNYAWTTVEGMNPRGGRLGELLGYDLTEDPVFHTIADRTGQTGGRSVSGDPAVQRLVLQANGAHPTTRRIAEANRLFEVREARALSVRPGAPPAIRREDLLRTGPEGWIAPVSGDGRVDYTAPSVGKGQFTVGMAFEIDAPSDGAADAAPAKTGRVVIVSGRFCNNAGMVLFGDLALNICNWMAERRVLLDLKTPGYEAQYLTLQPQQLQRIDTFVLTGVPLFFLALGAVVVLVRRRQ